MENNETELHHHKKEAKELTAPMAIIVAGVLITGAILLGFSWLSGKDGMNNIQNNAALQPTTDASANTPAPVTASDNYLGSSTAPLTLVLYADFQCPFCGKFFNDTEEALNNTYVKDGKLAIVYRDFSFLGPESIKAAEAARCAADQGKFWQYHDYLFTHQQGENQGHFSNANLESFAQTLGLDTTAFNTCLNSDKYAKAVADSTQEGSTIGVQGTPKGFIMKDGKVLDTIDGYEPLSQVSAMLDKDLQ